MRRTAHILPQSEHTRRPRPEGSEPKTRAEIDARIHAECVSLIYHNTGPALIGNILVAFLSMLVIVPLTPRPLSMGWLIGLLLIAAARWWLKRGYAEWASEHHPSKGWTRRLAIILTINGFWWGTLSFLLVTYGGPVGAGFAPFIIAGMVAAAVATLGSLRSAYLCFTLPMVACLVLTLIWRGDPSSITMAGLTIAFEITMIGTVWQLSRIMRRDIELKLQNELLVRSLTAVNAKLSSANLSLEHEIEERKRAEERIELLATHDALTGLPNRRLQQERFAQAAALVSRGAGAAAILFIDLDNFKEVNDSLGHCAGDALLRVLADRLRHALREGDSVCRQGGDEFLLLIANADGKATIAGVAERILQSMSTPVEIEGKRIKTGCSIGISLYPHDGEDFELLVNRADKALYRAKQQGRGAYRFFSSELE